MRSLMYVVDWMIKAIANGMHGFRARQGASLVLDEPAKQGAQRGQS